MTTSENKGLLFLCKLMAIMLLAPAIAVGLVMWMWLWIW